MDIDRHVIIEAAAAAVPVVAMVGIFLLIAAQYSDESGELTPTGGQALIGAFVLFVLVMLGIGILLSFTDFYGRNPNGT